MNIENESENSVHAESDEEFIVWSDIVFLPFNPLFQFILMISIVVEGILGPLQMVYPVVHCWHSMDDNLLLLFFKYTYVYICDPLFAIDTLLRILHRQITSTAMKREHLPTPLLQLLIDILSILPINRLISSDVCLPIQVFPNILCILEVLTCYRIVNYFQLLSTHNTLKLAIGTLIVFIILVNAFTCVLVLLTLYGLCFRCEDGIYDWRRYIFDKLNKTDRNISTYLFGTTYTMSYLVGESLDEMKPSTYLGYIFSIFLMLFSFLLHVYMVFPKLFSECVLRQRRLFEYNQLVKRIVYDTKQKNSASAALVINRFYSISWTTRNGVSWIPFSMISNRLPRYLKFATKYDLLWSVFFHSPTLRRTSTAFKRYIGECFHLDLKLPGEKLFSGPNCLSNMYYLKSGTVHVLSSDDGVTPILSVTSGTVFGDISFYVPTINRNVKVICTDYCEVFYIKRSDLLRALNKFPLDHRDVVKKAKERLKHAREIYNYKQILKGIDRSEDEGIFWLKKRWWELYDVVKTWKKNDKITKIPCHIFPSEESTFHCAKYIGQLVLCPEYTHNLSLFASVSFPWTLWPDSVFQIAWNRTVQITVFFVLISYPAFISGQSMGDFFVIFRVWVDIVYVIDIGITLTTAITRQEQVITNFVEIILKNCKRTTFILDVLATLWIEDIAVRIGRPDLFLILHFNRLIKVYVIFGKRYTGHKVTNINPLLSIICNVVLLFFTYSYLSSFIIYIIYKKHNFYIKCDDLKNELRFCDSQNAFVAVFVWIFRTFFVETNPKNVFDLYVSLPFSVIDFLITNYSMMKIGAALYLYYKNLVDYQKFVINTTTHYVENKIHPDLMKRLKSHLSCQWQFFYGIEIMRPYLLEMQPYDVYWKAHGERAVKVIAGSKAFSLANRLLIKELAQKAKFKVVPRQSTTIMFGVQAKHVTWLIRGFLTCEYHTEDGELKKVFFNEHEILSMSSTFLWKTAVRTYTAYTDCEFLIINKNDFFNTIKRYPEEWAYIETAVDEIKQPFFTSFRAHLLRHRKYQKKLRERVFQARASMIRIDDKEVKKIIQKRYSFKNFWINPSSKFLYFWMIFRAIVVIISIICSSLQGNIYADKKYILSLICIFCAIISFVDIIIKMKLAFYNEKGIIVSDARKCVSNYLLKTFLVDAFATFPWYTIVKYLPVEHDNKLLLLSFFNFGQVYIVLGLFNYMANSPTAETSWLMIMKWQIFLILFVINVSQYFVSKCLHFTWNENMVLTSINYLNDTCWYDSYNKIGNEEIDMNLVKIIHAHSISLIQSAMMRFNLPTFDINYNDPVFCLMIVLTGTINWGIEIYMIVLLILQYRVDNLFYHKVLKIKSFLHSEGVERSVIDRAVAYFKYWWIRTKGINVNKVINERLGVVFRQDLGYYFYKKTLQALDSILLGGDLFQRQLATVCVQHYFLPEEVIMREMDLTGSIFIVHRGRVKIKYNNRALAFLTKGGIFGQLTGEQLRPVKVTALADDYVDILEISVQKFQECLDDEIKDNILDNEDSEFDFMCLENPIQENPYNTVEYILKGKKAIQLPWMKDASEAHSGTCYMRWLYITYLIEPILSAIIVMYMFAVSKYHIATLWIPLYILDVVHLLYFITEFYSTELRVIDGECIIKPLKLRRIYYFSFYIDLFTLIFPMLSFVSYQRRYQLAKILRLRLLRKFRNHIQKLINTKFTLGFMQFLTVVILLHTYICIWLFTICKPEEYDTRLFKVRGNFCVDPYEWAEPNKNRIRGCPQITYQKGENTTSIESKTLLIPRDWRADYILAMRNMFLMFTNTDDTIYHGISLKHIYIKIVIAYFVRITRLWVISMAISFMYLKFRELYKFDFQIDTMCIYLKNVGLSHVLLRSVKKYCRNLWHRQRGRWLPELAEKAPLCLRQDIMMSLYAHHLDAPPLFRLLPSYFIRQLAARLKRMVIFQGEFIVREGDVVPVIYFIHEGDVEKYYTEATTGQLKFQSLLTTNGYFGIMNGLFPDSPFQFSYFTRTVVDMVFLVYQDWQDLLEGYPDLKVMLYEAAKQLKRDIKIN